MGYQCRPPAARVVQARTARVADALAYANQKTRLLAGVRAYFRDDYTDSMTADEVIDAGPRGDLDTGLVNADGWPIYRTRETVKFGFVP
jgi:hypothetical protein